MITTNECTIHMYKYKLLYLVQWRWEMKSHRDINAWSTHPEYSYKPFKADSEILFILNKKVIPHF